MTHVEAAAETEAHASDTADTSPLQVPASDLAELPGAGPGLVWLLQECGVTSMAELATANAAELTGKIGLVGQLLDLEHWITHARSKF